MNTQQLEYFMRFDPVVKPFFRGVHASDEILNIHIDSLPAGLICNTDPSYKGGSHWISMWIDIDRRGQMFDSYGNSPQFYSNSFEYFLKSNSTTYSYNKEVLQSLDSSTCGIWCMAYIINMSSGKTLDYFISLFGNSRANNDKQVLKMIQDRYGVSLKMKDKSFRGGINQESFTLKDFLRERVNNVNK